MPRPGFRLILKTTWFFSGCKGVSKVAVEIRAERSSPRIESGTNCQGSVGN